MRGTAREIGQQHGEAMREQIREVIGRYDDFIGSAGRDQLALPSTLAHVRKRFDAASLAEIEGLAEAVGIPATHVLAYNLDAALFPAYVAGCTQALRLGVANGGVLLHAVNEDSPLLLHLGGHLPRVVQVRRRTDAPDFARRVVLFTIAGQCAGPNGLADNGLSVTSTTLLDGPPPHGIPEGVPHPQLVKRILETASSLEEALQIARTFPRAGRWSLLISDADRDRGAYLEYDSERILSEELVRDVRTSTNHALTGPATGCVTPEHSQHRAARAIELLGGPEPLDVAHLKTALRDRLDLGRGRAVAHPTMNTVRRVDNVMSLVIEPKARRFHVTDRVIPPGASEDDPAEWLTLSYGSAPTHARNGAVQSKRAPLEAS